MYSYGKNTGRPSKLNFMVLSAPPMGPKSVHIKGHLTCVVDLTALSLDPTLSEMKASACVRCAAVTR